MKTSLRAVDIATPDVLMAYEGWSIKRLSEFFMSHKISGAPVIASDHSLVGVVSLSDIVAFEGKSSVEKTQLFEDVYAEFVGQQYDAPLVEQMARSADENCTVNQIMTPEVVQVDEQADLQEIAYVMLQHGIRRVFVSKHGIVAGVISTSNILQAIAQ
ncbi:MAG: CBS domain-containing protein [Bermanella sp.]